MYYQPVQIDLLGPLPAPPSHLAQQVHNQHKSSTIQDICTWQQMTISIPKPKTNVCSILESCARLQDLAVILELDIWNSQLKDEFQDLFQHDILHVDQLPDNFHQ